VGLSMAGWGKGFRAGYRSARWFCRTKNGAQEGAHAGVRSDVSMLPFNGYQ